MDNYARVEKALREYKMTESYIENCKIDLEYLESDIGVKGISYDGVSGGKTNNINDIVGDTVLSMTEKKHYLNHQIKVNQMEIDKIDNALAKLEGDKRTILVEYYINDREWWYVASLVKYSERHCKTKRREAISELIKGIYREKE